jgi:sialate O-acetylesterase
MAATKSWATIIGLLLLAPVACLADDTLWMPSIFSEGMVLQRGMVVPVWGRAQPGAAVAVTLYDGGKKLAAGEAVAAAETGRWRVDLPELPTGGRFTLLIEATHADAPDAQRRMFSNVLVGEVWLFCGQSNMLHPMNACAERDDAIARRHEFPLIRTAQIGHRRTAEITEPQEDVKGFWGPVKWEDAAYQVPRSSATDISGSCSAVGYFFARALAETLGRDVPVAVIEIGAILPVQSWVDVPELETAPVLTALKGKGYPDATSRAFKANIAPLAPYACRGAMYYQGEMNAGNGLVYQAGLAALIASWRRAWARPDLPFLVVQLPGFISHQAGKTALDMDAASLAKFAGQNAHHGFIPVREAQLRVSREMPNVGLVVTLDLGEKFDIHPPRKRAVGERLALQARKLAYGENDVVADGPMPRGFDRRAGGFTIRFDGVGSGLVSRGELAGFEVADAAGVWHAATAAIEGDALHVRAADVPEPTGVRYAWLGYPEVTLFNREGLPATPFRHPATGLDEIQREGKAAESP